jgi:hypothetical protein
MPPDEPFTRRLTGRRVLLRAGLPLAAAATLAAVLLGGGPAGASTGAATPEPRYSALAGNEPTGLALVTSHHPRSPGDPVGPTWPAQAPEGAEGRWPVADTIRRVRLGVPGLSAWIARSASGGICVLLYDGVPTEGISSVGLGCSGPERLEHGASVEMLEVPGMPGKAVAAGVVPDGVTAVRSTMADGSIYTAPVSDNAWARVSDGAAASGQESTLLRGG